MKKLVMLLICLFFILGTSILAKPVGVQFAWQQDIPSPNDLKGWKLYKSNTIGGPYIFVTEILFTSIQTEYTATLNVDYPDNAKTKYFFVLTAFDTSGNESGYSNEVAKEMDFLAPVAPKSFRVLN